MVDLSDGYSETPENTRAFASNNSYSFPIYYDSMMEGTYTYGVTAIPFTLAISADGEIVTSHLGSMSQDELQNIIDALLQN